MDFTPGTDLSIWAHVVRLARERPNDDALISLPAGAARRLTYAAFHAECERLARGLAEAGLRPGERLVAALPNDLEFALVAYATWRCGATFIPLSPKLPLAERSRLLALAEPRLVAGDWADGSGGDLRAADLPALDGAELAPVPAPAEHVAIASGGSTGAPKLIVNTAPLVWPPDGPRNLRVAGLRPGQRQLVLGPLYHNGPFAFGLWGLSMGHTLILPARFDAAEALAAIDRHRVSFLFAVPTHLHRMQRALELDGVEAELGSIETLLHSAAVCPAWLKRWWIDRIGAERVIEVYGTTEGIGMTMVRGDEWLRRPGTVGRAYGYTVRVVGEDDEELPAGSVGEIFLAPDERQETHRYLGAPPLPATSDGLQSVGDAGWLDEEGWLYISDRRTDLIVSGGANVYPAEVEGALTEHPGVLDAAVIGLPDDEWGRRLHAIVEVERGERPDEDVLDAWMRERLAAYKVPRSYEYVADPLRGETGKLTRSRLLAERCEGAEASA